MGASRALIPTGYNRHLISFQFGILAFWYFRRSLAITKVTISQLLIEWGSGPLWKPNTGEFFRQNRPPPKKKKNQQGNKLVLQEKSPPLD